MNSSARLRTIEINSSRYRAIKWTVEGFYFDSDSVVTAGIGLQGTNTGVAFYQNTAMSTTTRRVYLSNGTNQDALINYRMRGAGEALRKRNLSILLMPSTSYVYLMEDDQVMYYANLTGILNNGILRGTFDLATNESASHYGRASQVRLELWNN
ncbi:hypothetical protein D3C77_577510 [compost metagenome]